MNKGGNTGNTISINQRERLILILPFLTGSGAKAHWGWFFDGWIEGEKILF